MVSKSIAVVLVAMCALQGSQAGLMDSMFNNFVLSMNNTRIQINTQIDNFKKEAGVITAGVFGGIASAVSGAVSQVSALREKAKQFGTDVSGCVDASQDKITSAMNNSESGMESCMSATLQSMQPDLDKLDAVIGNGRLLFQQASQNTSVCGMDLFCTGRVVAEAAKQAAVLAGQGIQVGIKLATNFPSDLSSYNTCAEQQVSQTVNSLMGIYLQEGQCIQKGMSNAIQG